MLDAGCGECVLLQLSLRQRGAGLGSQQHRDACGSSTEMARLAPVVPSSRGDCAVSGKGIARGTDVGRSTGSIEA